VPGKEILEPVCYGSLIDMLGYQLLIVYPESDDAPYREYGEPDPLLLSTIARRLFAACRERSREVAIHSSRELLKVPTDQLNRVTATVVDPMACAATSGDEPLFFSKLSSALKRIMVLAEAVEGVRYGQQFRLPVTFDAVFDIGFVSQGKRHSFSEVPYHFVFNGPTQEEKQIVAELSPSQERRIPWAAVGSRSSSYLDLVADLVDRTFYPGGFCILQHTNQQGRKGTGLLSPSGLSAVLSKTDYYVWSSDTSFAYYESFRFIQAVLAGAVPCKVDDGDSWDKSGIPGIFSSVGSFCTRVQEEDQWSMYCSSRDFFESGGLLAEHLERALHCV
jgi:hypothetical protein